MKNNKRYFLLSLLLAIVTPLMVGCNNKDNKENKNNEITDSALTKVIEESNISANVDVGPYESMLTGEVKPVSIEEQLFTSSTVLDAPRDYVTTISYIKDDNSLQAVNNIMKNVVSANNEIGIISIKDRGGNITSKNLLTLSGTGTSFTVSNPNGYEYGEVYQIEINDAPYLGFDNKSTSIRTLTIEIEDDPSEQETIEEQDLKDNIINIDLSKISNKKELEKENKYTFEYDGDINLKQGDIFYATNKDKTNKYLDFYGIYQESKKLNNGHIEVSYSAPNMDDIYDSFHLKKKEDLDMSTAETILNNDLAVSEFKKSGLAKGLARAILTKTNNDIDILGNILDNFKLNINVNYVNNRVGFKISGGIYGYKIADKKYFTFEIGYEKVTDYSVDFDVSIRTKWIFPVGVDYKIKCLEDNQEAFYVKVNVSKSFNPNPDDQKDSDFLDALSKGIESVKNGDGSIDGIKNLGPSTSGSKTSWPIFKIDCYYLAPVTFQLKGEIYIDAALQCTGLFKKEIHSTKVDFNFTNMDGSGQDEYYKTTEASNWIIGFMGDFSFEIGLKLSFSFSILGLYDYLRAQAYATAYLNASLSGMIMLDIFTNELGTEFTGYIGIDFALTVGMRVGLNFKLLFVESNIDKLLFSEYLFRIKYENSIEHWSSLSEDGIDMNEQSLNIDNTNILWLNYFDTLTMTTREKKYNASDRYQIFSGSILSKEFINETSGYTFTYTPTDPSLIEIDEVGNIHVKDATPASFSTTFIIHVSNWAGTAKDKVVTINYTASDTKELYAGETLLGAYRPNYQLDLPEGPKVYGKEFLYYKYNDKEYHTGDKFTMLDQTVVLEPIYRILPYYDVNFYDGLGNLVYSESIMEGESAHAPSALLRDRFMDKEQYVFINWTVDYSKIMGDTNVYSLYISISEVN